MEETMKTFMTSAIALGAIFALDASTILLARGGGHGGGHEAHREGEGEGDRNESDAVGDTARQRTMNSESNTPEDRSHTLQGEERNGAYGYGRYGDAYDGGSGCVVNSDGTSTCN
jgi:hypothetical protein